MGTSLGQLRRGSHAAYFYGCLPSGYVRNFYDLYDKLFSEKLKFSQTKKTLFFGIRIWNNISKYGCKLIPFSAKLNQNPFHSLTVCLESTIILHSY